ncbi:MAG TPA: MFS transporter [Trebonia sp.]
MSSIPETEGRQPADVPVPSRGFRAMFGSLRIRNYRLFCIGQLFANTGQWTQRVAQDWLVLSITGNTTDVGITVALQFIPSLFFGLPGGLIADRYPKRRILQVTQSGMALMAALLAGLTLTHAIKAWHIFVIAFLLGSFAAVDNPTRQSFVNELVGGSKLRNAISLNSAIFQSGALIGPALSGVLINLIGPGFSFAVNALCFIAPLTSLALMDSSQFLRRAGAERAPGQLRDGLRYVRDRPALLWPTVMVGVFGMFAGNMPVTLAALAKYVFRSGAGGYGALSSIVAGGALVGALLTATGWPRLRWVVGAGLGVAGLDMIASAVSSQLAFSVLLLFIGACTMTMLASSNSIVQTTAGDHIRGRVMSVYLLVYLLCAAAGGPLLGAIDQHLGPQIGLFITGAVPGVVIAAVGVRLARLRRAASTAAAPGHLDLAGEGPCSSTVGG